MEKELHMLKTYADKSTTVVSQIEAHVGQSDMNIRSNASSTT